MAIALSCSCGKQLKLKDEMAGKKVKCPGCQTVLTVPASAEPAFAAPEPAFAPPEPAFAPPEPGGFAPPDAGGFAPPEPAPDEGGGFDFAALGGAAHGAKPTYPGQPAEFKPGVGATRPRSAGSPKLLIIGVVAFVVLAAGAAGTWLMLRSSFDAYRWLPDDSQMVVRIDVDGIRGSALYKKLSEKNESVKEIRRTYGVKEEDIRAVAVGGRPGKTVTVLHLRRELAAKDVFPGRMNKETTVGKYKVYADSFGGNAFCFPSSDVLLISDSAEVLNKVLERNGSAKFSAGMLKAIDEMESRKSIAVAVDVKGLAGERGQGPSSVPAAVKSIEAVVVGIDIGADLKLGVRVVCADSGSADDLRKMAEGFIVAQKDSAPADLKEAMAAVKITASGTVLSGEVTVKGDAVVNFLNNPFQMMRMMR